MKFQVHPTTGTSMPTGTCVHFLNKADFASLQTNDANLHRDLTRTGFSGELGQACYLNHSDTFFVGLTPAEGSWRRHQRYETYAYMRAAGHLADALNKGKVDTVHIVVNTTNIGVMRAIATGLELGNWKFDRETPNPERIKQINFYCDQLDVERTAAEQQINNSAVVACAQNVGRWLTTRDGNDLTPTAMAEFCEKHFTNTPVEVQTRNADWLEEQAFTLTLGVAAASRRVKPPTFVELRYCGTGDKNAPWLWFDPKCVTMDFGGGNLKPGNALAEMKADMAAASTIVAVFTAAHLLGLKVNIAAAFACAENGFSVDGYIPGQVLPAGIAGTKVHIENTDAEGRLLLADNLSWILRNYGDGACGLISIATLTGAMCVAHRSHPGVWSSDDYMMDHLVHSSVSAGEPLQLMNWDESSLAELLASKDMGGEADIGNSVSKKEGGAVRAAEFLAYFWQRHGPQVPYVHMDIASQLGHSSNAGIQRNGGHAPQVRTLINGLEELYEHLVTRHAQRVAAQG